MAKKDNRKLPRKVTGKQFAVKVSKVLREAVSDLQERFGFSDPIDAVRYAISQEARRLGTMARGPRRIDSGRGSQMANWRMRELDHENLDKIMEAFGFDYKSEAVRHAILSEYDLDEKRYKKE